MVNTRAGTLMAGLFVALSFSGQATALTVYDIIQLSEKNYRDDDILALIKATDSAFGLKAGDITRLMELGVSENVIQAMLKAVPEEAVATPGKVYQGYTSAADPSESATAPSEHVVTAQSGSGAVLAGGRIAYAPFNESGVGRHHHSVVTLAGLQLLILRDEGSFSSVAARAAAVVKRLGEVAVANPGTFRTGHTPEGDAVMFYEENAQNPTTILNVSHADARAYQRRSGRTVTSALLAAYWSDLLSDYWSIALNSTTPLRLSDVHEGEALNALFEQWSKSADSGASRLADASQLLPPQAQQHLLQLATRVPHDFTVREPHRQK
ncbi:hypothetical protein MNBD_GAMMA15-673 [hydrothermal vent metagenome]|uniref:Uncharacterized protein n=1 Tax=hydrothermal vent metagenome TaxID=652676 RepID=A0A3B0XYB2_9ZZZZ